MFPDTTSLLQFRRWTSSQTFPSNELQGLRILLLCALISLLRLPSMARRTNVIFVANYFELSRVSTVISTRLHMMTRSLGVRSAGPSSSWFQDLFNMSKANLVVWHKPPRSTTTSMIWRDSSLACWHSKYVLLGARWVCGHLISNIASFGTYKRLELRTWVDLAFGKMNEKQTLFGSQTFVEFTYWSIRSPAIRW